VDNGIRNAITAQFNWIDQRNDLGLLWENFMMMERMKHRSYQNLYGNTYFWRTYSQQEIDLVEERDGKLRGYEFKWASGKSASVPPSWKNAYPDAEYSVITPANYQQFILP
jgi:predicted AAA+ superfamily ATPase